MIQHFSPDFVHLEDVKVYALDQKEIIDKINGLDERRKKAENGQEAVALVKEYFALEDDIQTARCLINIRYTINTKDEYYHRLYDERNQILPQIQEATNRFDKDFYSSPFRKELVEAFGQLYFDQVALGRKTFSPEIINDLVEENKLVREYTDLLSSGIIEFRGEKYSIPQMGKFTTSLDRETRKEASQLVWDFYAKNDEKIGRIYDQRVHVRDRRAKKLGFKNYLPLGYARRGRLDWNEDDAKEYRRKILEEVVPLSNRIRAAQKERLGYKEDTRFYDYSIFYKSGNPTPKGTEEELLAAASQRYNELSPVAGKYFDFMVSHHCLDLLAKPGKAGGGYREYIPGLKTSFIFANFNGTSDDVDTLTHEFGHSLQGFLGGERLVPNYRCPGRECAERHSRSREYLTYPYRKLFFKEDEEKYRYQHLCDAITFIPYGCIVDAFQAHVYENPDRTWKERKAYWRSLEKEYLPYREYPDNAFLQSGGYFYRQGHIFQNPLYYLDYTIAQVVALEFFSESLRDPKKTFDKYLAFCRLGGTLPFRKLLAKAGIENPMDGDTLKDVRQSIWSYLGTFHPNDLEK